MSSFGFRAGQKGRVFRSAHQPADAIKQVIDIGELPDKQVRAGLLTPFDIGLVNLRGLQDDRGC
jgi:hypothetical protein